MTLIVEISRAGMISRSPFSTWMTSSSVFSMREPTGARKCSFIRPASTDGKKSVPTTNTSPKLASAIAPAIAIVNRRCASATPSSRA